MIILIKAVIFDIGGVTIKDPMDYIYKTVGKRFKISRGKIKEKFGERDPLVTMGKISTKEFWLWLANELKIKDASLLERVWINSLREGGTLNKGIVKIINRVKASGYKVATLSNTIEPHEKVHRKLGQYKFFNHVFLSNRLGMEKPDVRIYRYATKKLGVKPSECVFIDDKLRNVKGARKAGMNAILFKNSVQLKKELKRYL